MTEKMAVAMIYPEPEKGGRGKNSLATSGFSQQLLSQARAVLAYSLRVRGSSPRRPALAVPSGSLSSRESPITRLAPPCTGRKAKYRSLALVKCGQELAGFSFDLRSLSDQNAQSTAGPEGGILWQRTSD